MSDINKKEQTKKILISVGESLSKVTPETKNMVQSFATNMKKHETIQLFNNHARDLFNIMLELETKLNITCNIKGYLYLFDKAIKINAKLPIDKFTLTILEYAVQIYSGDDKCIINMEIPDGKINVDNEFGLIRTKMFKDIWIQLDQSYKDTLMDTIIHLTTFAHVYFIQTISES